DVVDQAELVDIDGDFRIVDRLQDLDHGRLEVASRAARRRLLFVAGEETGEIIPLTGNAVGNASARRRSHRFDLFGLDLSLLVHANTRFTCSIPLTSASISELSLCAAKLARAVASTPSQRINGCAQWWPARTATPASS